MAAERERDVRRRVGHLMEVIGLLASMQVCAAPELTALEARWLETGWPALAHARERDLPVDIVVQPQDAPGASPLAMGFRDGRCLLVLSMRGNPAARQLDAMIDRSVYGAVVEAIMAHEIGHCWRHVQQRWHLPPAGFVEPASQAAADHPLAALQRDAESTRREEGHADLVGLAWTWQRHPGQYAEVHGWLRRYRAGTFHAGRQHDTRRWIEMAHDGRIFESAGTVFEQAQRVWAEGLRDE